LISTASKIGPILIDFSACKPYTARFTLQTIDLEKGIEVLAELVGRIKSWYTRKSILPNIKNFEVEK
jgi:hypothetical protein